MHNPLQGVVTSEHEDDGGYDGHWGRDIGTRDLGTSLLPVWVYGVGRPVYSAFRMQIKSLVRWSVKGNRKDTWARYKTGNGLLGANPDGEGQGYNHMMPVAGLKVGDWVEEGQLIGHLDLSGNQSAPHLHFETWSDWRDYRTAFSPKILFDKYGITTMDDPAAPSFDFAGNPTTSSPKEDTLSAAEVAQINAEIKAQADRIINYIAERTTVPVTRSGQPDTRSLATIVGNLEDNLALVPERVWDYELTYRDQSRGTDRQVPAGKIQHYLSWGNAKAIDALTLKES